MAGGRQKYFSKTDNNSLILKRASGNSGILHARCVSLYLTAKTAKKRRGMSWSSLFSHGQCLKGQAISRPSIKTAQKNL